MKTLRLSILGLVAATLYGCQTSDDFIAPEVNTSIPIELYNEIVQVPTTRVDDEGFCDGDAVGIYVVNFENGSSGTLKTEDNQADNIKFVFDEENYKWTPEQDVYYKDNHTHVDIIGYYPYANPSSVNAYPFEVQRDQSSEAAHGQLGGYEASDFLWGIAGDITPTASRISLKFHHRMAGVQVSLIKGDNWDDGEWERVKKQVLITNTKRNATIDLATGIISATGEVQSTGIIPYTDGNDFRAVVVPQTIDAGTALLSITVGGVPYNYKFKEDGILKSIEYFPSQLHKIPVRVSKKIETGEPMFEAMEVSITAWEVDNASHQSDAREYVVIHNPEAGRLERTVIDRLEMDPTKIKNLKLTGKINANDYTFMRNKMTSLTRLNLREVESKIDGVYKIPQSAFNSKKTLSKCVLPEKLERIEVDAFTSTTLTGTILLPEGLKYVSGFTSTKITNVHLPSTLEEIGANAFMSCASLMCEITLPASLKFIRSNAFCNSAIKGNLALPESLEEIWPGAFSGCSNLTGSLTIPNSVKTIYSSSFSNCGFTGNLTLPKGLEEIQDNAFSGTKFKGELNIPSTVTTIGNSAFANTEFNGTLFLPKELISLGSRVFSGCWRLSGVVEIPENIIAISSQLFYKCRNIEGVVLHKDVEVIESQAFADCFYVSSIVSKAKNAPTIASNSFSGVAKDNFTVEVPEASIQKYKFASGWSEFKRIAAHREFSISRNLLRTLNDEYTKTFTLRAPAGEDWSIESKPDWVTVTPTSGSGKVDVTITVNEMTAGDVGTFKTSTLNSNGNVSESTHSGRGGEVVFLLDGKDYRTRMTVEQYDYEYGDGDLYTHQTKGVGNGVNIVLMGDCFDAKDISEGKYKKAMEDAYSYFFDIEPYKTYKDYFNVYSIFGVSPDSGMGTVNTIREARFGSQYTLNEGVSPDFETVFAGACVAPINDDIATTLVILVENSNEYDGLCYMWGDGSAVALIPMSTDPAPYDFRGIVHHEAGGHGFGKLADEYIYHNAFIQSCKCICCGHVDDINTYKRYGFYENISLTGNMKSVPWSHMIYDPQYSNVVDVYEGAFKHTRGVFRSEATSCMNNNIPYYNAISREAMVKRIMKYAGEQYSFEAFKAKDYESLSPSASTIATRAWDGVSTGSSSQHNQREPKFMGEMPKFNKEKF